jgi:hypothetical protein
MVVVTTILSRAVHVRSRTGARIGNTGATRRLVAFIDATDGVNSVLPAWRWVEINLTLLLELTKDVRLVLGFRLHWFAWIDKIHLFTAV